MSIFRLVKNKFWVASFLVFFNLLLISIQVPYGGKESLLEKIFFVAFSPVPKIVVGSYRFLAEEWQEFKGWRITRKENQELKKENFFLRQEDQLLREKLRLILEQKEMEKVLKDLPGSIIPARIVGFDTSNYYRSAIINRGTEDGIVINLPVCDKWGNLVGRTAEPIADHAARVVLITSEESGVGVISSSDKMPGILSGDGQGQCVIKYVVASSPLGVKGDEVQTSGFDKIYPPGIKVGQIISVSADKGVFKRIVVKPYFDLRDLELVAILKTTEIMR
ncbi:MAG: rod shape-determining protein MreC [Candidatus Saccharicenans sp.]|nr:MAG: rod shape-determining protein MreC [Candidatus Aminicenantes bacterium]HEK86317.1 rod shape-determining protein MreC [Candidatus Aminicenantes bacterium]